MINKLCKSIVPLGLFLAAVAAPFAIYAQRETPIPEELNKKLLKWQDLISNSLKNQPINEWEGHYTYGDHHPDNFVWTEEAGFMAYASDHYSAPTRVNFGRVSFKGDTLILDPELKAGEANVEPVAQEYAAVLWGEVHFLVPPSEFEKFAYAVHSESEANLVGFLLKMDDLEKPLDGLPDLPKRFRKIMKMKAIEARILSINKGSENDSDPIFELSVGSRDLVQKGMSFYYSDDCSSFHLIVESVETKRSAARIIGSSWRYGEECLDEKESMLEVGTAVSSKANGIFRGTLGRVRTCPVDIYGKSSFAMTSERHQ